MLETLSKSSPNQESLPISTSSAISALILVTELDFDTASKSRLAKRREILIFPWTAGNTGNSREILGNKVPHQLGKLKYF